MAWQARAVSVPSRCLKLGVDGALSRPSHVGADASSRSGPVLVRGACACDDVCLRRCVLVGCGGLVCVGRPRAGRPRRSSGSPSRPGTTSTARRPTPRPRGATPGGRWASLWRGASAPRGPRRRPPVLHRAESSRSVGGSRRRRRRINMYMGRGQCSPTCATFIFYFYCFSGGQACRRLGRGSGSHRQTRRCPRSPGGVLLRRSQEAAHEVTAAGFAGFTAPAGATAAAPSRLLPQCFDWPEARVPVHSPFAPSSRSYCLPSPRYCFVSASASALSCCCRRLQVRGRTRRRRGKS